MDPLVQASLLCFSLIGPIAPGEEPPVHVGSNVSGNTPRAICIQSALASPTLQTDFAAMIAPFSDVQSWATNLHELNTPAAILDLLAVAMAVCENDPLNNGTVAQIFACALDAID